jgi:hypothetical protein
MNDVVTFRTNLHEMLEAREHILKMPRENAAKPDSCYRVAAIARKMSRWTSKGDFEGECR